MMGNSVASSGVLVLASAYAHAPSTPSATTAIVLVAIVSLALRLAIQPQERFRRVAASCGLIWFSLALGTATSLFAANVHLSQTFLSLLETGAGVALYSLVTALLPLAALATGTLAAGPNGEGQRFPPLTAFFSEGVLFAVAGVVYERVSSIGRVGWLVRGSPIGERSFFDSTSSFGGTAFTDFLIGGAGFALAQFIWSLKGSSGFFRDRGELVDTAASHDLLGGEEPTDSLARNNEAIRDTATRTGGTGRHTRQSALLLLIPLALCVIVDPLWPAPRIQLIHPSPEHPDFVYPPLKVGCIAPQHSYSLDDWLRETRVSASRGAKVISWPEAAVKLGRSKDGRGGDGDERSHIASAERKLLLEVGKVCDAHKTFVLTTYAVPFPSEGKHARKHLNVATLVGPRSPDSEDDLPNIAFTTNKHHPVRFVESYTHHTREVPELGSKGDALPLAEIEMPNPPHTPAPHSTPLERLSLTAAICQDIAYPSLLARYLPTARLEHRDKRPRSPQLILNPSASPPDLPGLARLSLAQARSRAIEQGAFVLRCEPSASPSGPGSTLIDPSGNIRVFTGAGDVSGGSGSWEAEIRPEESRDRAGWLSWTEVDARFGVEGRVLLLLAALTAAVYAVESGTLVAGVCRLYRVPDGDGARTWTDRARQAWSALTARPFRLGGHDRPPTPASGGLLAEAEQGRLVEVD